MSEDRIRRAEMAAVRVVQKSAGCKATMMMNTPIMTTSVMKF